MYLYEYNGNQLSLGPQIAKEIPFFWNIMTFVFKCNNDEQHWKQPIENGWNRMKQVYIQSQTSGIPTSLWRHEPVVSGSTWACTWGQTLDPDPEGTKTACLSDGHRWSKHLSFKFCLPRVLHDCWLKADSSQQCRFRMVSVLNFERNRRSACTTKTRHGLPQLIGFNSFGHTGRTSMTSLN